MNRVYLAGPIFSVSPERAKSWREVAATLLVDTAEVANPMIVSETDPKRIVEHDLEMILSCNAVLALVDLEIPSWGTPMEIFFASRHGIPVFVWGSTSYPPWIVAHAYHTDKYLWDSIQEIKRWFARTTKDKRV
ncbi:MAG: nucleoside 2-deoxyribosyltransferase [Nitrososphaerota archaeon]